jgi:glycosyltransferase involved in cell wall biosynthesis
MTGEYSSADFRARFARQARQAAASSDMIIAISEFTANQVNALLDVPRSKIRVVHHGVMPPNERRKAHRENLVLFVGALQVRKNVARLVEAFERMPSSWRLTLAGAANGFGAAAIMDRIEASSARERITVTGYVPAEELEALYASASIFAFPSLDEGFGMPVLDAMARGIPVLTSNRSALPEVAGDAALLVEPDRSEAIAEALIRLAEDVNLRKKLAEAGRARAKQFSWGLAVEQTYAVYRELLS